MSIEILFRRYQPVLVAGGMALAAYFQARGVTWLIEAALDRPTARAPVKPVSTVVVAPPSVPTSPTTRRHELPPAVPPDPLSWPDCPGVEVVIVSESKDAGWSLTTLREAGQPRARLRRVGDGVAGKQVAFIGFNPKQQAPSVWLQGDGTFCQSLLGRAPSAASATPEPPPATPPAMPSVARTPDGALSLVRSVRVVPEQRDGRTIGLRLFGIRPNSLLESLGVKNGDRLESINGLSVATPESALMAYARLRTAERLNVRLDRRGKPVELTVNIN